MKEKNTYNPCLLSYDLGPPLLFLLYRACTCYTNIKSERECMVSEVERIELEPNKTTAKREWAYSNTIFAVRF